MHYNFSVADYNPRDLDKKWQQRWVAERAFEPTEDSSKPKFYCLEMFAYPSGHAHVGHVRNYIIGDVIARTRRMRGYNVLHPFGWDAFGLPAENAAIKNGIHPEVSTLDNIEHMKGQLQRLGISYAWDREIATCSPEYYHWNQWLFVRMYERGLAYRRKSTVNWCDSCQTVLANEQVVDGGCWRCGTIVTTRELEQWFFRITAYADELLEGLAGLDAWPDKVLTMQRNWIGRSEGARLRFPIVEADETSGARAVDVFTTRADTVFGATFVTLGPEHPLVEAFARESADPQTMRARGQPLPHAGPHRAHERRDREGGLLHGAVRDQPVHAGAGAHLGRQLRGRRLRHRCRHGGARARSARFRVRSQVRSSGSRGGRASRRASRARAGDASTEAVHGLRRARRTPANTTASRLRRRRSGLPTRHRSGGSGSGRSSTG